VINDCFLKVPSATASFIIDAATIYVPLKAAITAYYADLYSLPSVAVARIYAPLARVEVVSSARVAVGNSITVHAAARDDAGNLAPESGAFEWTSSDPTGLAVGVGSGSNGTFKGLRAGTYSARVNLGALAATSQVTVDAVTTAPAIGISPSAVNFSAPSGGPLPGSQTLSISNEGTGGFNR
jgi:hypothetical protein